MPNTAAAPAARPPHRLIVVYQMDPRGQKVGGIETHVRTLLARRPDDFEVALVGVDAVGDLPLGRPAPIEIAGRTLTFLPVLHYSDDKARTAARSLTQSLSLQFATGLLRHLPAIRRLAGPGPVSFELQRNEAAFLPTLLRRPSVLVVHNEYKRSNSTDSLVSAYWRLYRAGEAFAIRRADHIVCVNQAIREQIARVYPRDLARSEVMSVSVDTDTFRPSPWDTTDGVLRLVYAGRLEAQKDPPLMFSTIARLAERLAGKVELHYIGTNDPHQYAEFAAIADRTVRHGFRRSGEVAGILARCHMGILTSNFEGLPVFLLETLAAGRPMAAIRLPQFDPLLVGGVSGRLVERRESLGRSADAMAEGIVALWDEMRTGALAPERIAAKAEPYSVAAQLPRLFATHRRLQTARWGSIAGSAPALTAPLRP